jgi:dTDP-4-amino-4,6-dideoxygalactose transaminase
LITVTKSFLPDRSYYNELLDEIWDACWLTNYGVMERRLTSLLKNRFEVQDLALMNNGTVPLQIAVHELGKEGEIITTPFSYIATASSIAWEKCKPVFVDIDSEYLTINEQLIEDAITEKTTAILVTHVFGNPCNVETIQEIAHKYDLKVIYDAAHCFDVNYKGKSIFSYGDVSTCSFHATKLFHTAEGGALIANDPELMKKFKFAGNFGHDELYTFKGIGINSKMSEIQAAMGLAVLPAVEKIIAKRKLICEMYEAHLNWDELKAMKIREHTTWNYSYYPVIFKSEEQLLKTESILHKHNIRPRRYFYPSLNTINIFEYQKMNVSESIAERILCLPLYEQLALDDAIHISQLINLSF